MLDRTIVQSVHFTFAPATDHFKRLAINGVRALAQQRNGEIVTPI